MISGNVSRGFQTATISKRTSMRYAIHAKCNLPPSQGERTSPRVPKRPSRHPLRTPRGVQARGNSCPGPRTMRETHRNASNAQISHGARTTSRRRRTRKVQAGRGHMSRILSRKRILRPTMLFPPTRGCNCRISPKSRSQGERQKTRPSGTTPENFAAQGWH